MGYTLSFIADVKCGRNDVAGLLHHAARDVDKANGCEVRHSNKDIDPARTHLNETLVSDGKGGWVPCTDTRQILNALDARLSHVKTPLRKDAVVLRPFELQLDPEWYKAHTDPDERKAAEQHMRDWAADTFGADNLVYWTLHLDEANPHLEAGFCPVTDDGRLAQKDWFPSPSDLRKKHTEFRQYMTDAGYDIDMKRRKPGKFAKRMGVDEYKDFAQLQDERRDVEQQQEQLRTDRLNARDEARQRLERTAQQVRDAEQYGADVTAQADEYARTTRQQADDDAKATRDAADRDAEAKRKAADEYDKKIREQADEYARTVHAKVREKMQRELDEKREEYRQLKWARDDIQTALQGDLRSIEAQEARRGAAALLDVLGATVRPLVAKAARSVVVPPTVTPGPVAGSVFAEMKRRVAAMDAKSGPASVDGPTR